MNLCYFSSHSPCHKHPLHRDCFIRFCSLFNPLAILLVKMFTVYGIYDIHNLLQINGNTDRQILVFMMFCTINYVSRNIQDSSRKIRCFSWVTRRAKFPHKIRTVTLTVKRIKRGKNIPSKIGISNNEIRHSDSI